MTYNKFIQNIINTRGQWCKLDGYYERHHIVPKCLGGSNKKENIIYLTAQEHYNAHKLLYVENPDNKYLSYAWVCISKMTNSENHNIIITDDEFAKLRELQSVEVREINKGKIPWNKGKTNIYSQETRKKMGEKNVGNKYSLGRKHSNEAKEKIKIARANQIPPCIGRVVTEDEKNKISESLKKLHISPPNAIKVLDKTTNIIYDSRNKCCEQLGLDKKELNKAIDNNIELNGHIFKLLR